MSTSIEQTSGIVLKDTTVLIYKTLAERITRRTRLQLQDSPEDYVWPTPADLLKNWSRQWTTSTYSTVSIERSALMWHLQSSKPAGWEEAFSELKATVPRRSDFTNIDQVNSRRTRPPGRMIPEAHLTKLIQHLGTLRSSGEATGQQTQWFLLAGIASGARPIEWQHAKWIDEPNGVLRIFTAKVKARNAWDKIPPMTFTAEDFDNEMEGIIENPSSINGENSWYAVDFSRRISSINLTTEELRELQEARYLNGVELFRDVQIEYKYRTYVNLHMQAVHTTIKRERQLQSNWPEVERLSDEEIFAKSYYGRIRHCLWRACAKAFNNEELYSLVDTRSTFSANRKGLVGLQEAARELGHTPTTSKDFYAPASKAWSQYRQKHGNSIESRNQQADQQAAAGFTDSQGQGLLAGIPASQVSAKS